MMQPIEPANDNNLFRNVFHSDPAGKAIIALDRSCQAINRSFCRIMGMTECELLGLDLVRFLNGDSAAALHSAMYWETLHPGGDRARWLSVSMSFLPDSEGCKPQYSVLQIEDITERKLHEKEIARLHNEKQLILNSVSDGIYGLDLSGQLTFWNKAAESMTGYKRYELIGSDVPPLLHFREEPGAGSPCAAPLREAAAAGQPLYMQNALTRRKDGSFFPAECTLNPIHDNGKLLGTVITFKDTTEKEHARELMIKSEKLSMAGQLAAGIAHEIRNPLTSLKGFVQLIRSSGEGKLQYYEIMLAELNRIEGILNELLMLAKPQAVHFREKNVDDLLLQVITLLNSQALLRNVEIIMQPGAEHCRILCDENQIKQVFINIVKNAIDAMPQGGIINVHTSSTDSSVRVIIADQGCGIPEDKLRLIGEPFYTTKDKGTGLGLMVSFKIIEHHGGSIQIRSELNKGTDFQITFPCSPSDCTRP